MALASRLTSGQRLSARGRACHRSIPAIARPVQQARSSSAANQQLGAPCDRPAGCRRATLAARATPEAAAAGGGADAAGAEEFAILDVEELRGIRVNLDNQEPVVEYRVHWKDGSPDTWCARPGLAAPARALAVSAGMHARLCCSSRESSALHAPAGPLLTLALALRCIALQGAGEQRVARPRARL